MDFFFVGNKDKDKHNLDLVPDTISLPISPLGMQRTIVELFLTHKN